MDYTETTMISDYYINFVKQENVCPVCNDLFNFTDDSEDIYDERI